MIPVTEGGDRRILRLVWFLAKCFLIDTLKIVRRSDSELHPRLACSKWLIYQSSFLIDHRIHFRQREGLRFSVYRYGGVEYKPQKARCETALPRWQHGLILRLIHLFKEGTNNS